MVGKMCTTQPCLVFESDEKHVLVGGGITNNTQIGNGGSVGTQLSAQPTQTEGLTGLGRENPTCLRGAGEQEWRGHTAPHYTPLIKAHLYMSAINYHNTHTSSTLLYKDAIFLW